MKKSIYIAEGDNEQRAGLIEFFSAEGSFNVVGSSGSGITVVKEVIEMAPQVLLTELIMPGLDGYGILEKLQAAGTETEIFVISSLSKDAFISRALNLGAKYYMIKPIDLDSIAARIKGEESISTAKIGRMLENRSDLRNRSLEEKITNVFITVGIPAHIKGYQFLREAIKMAVEKPEVINSITKKLYPSIATRFETSASKVERAIRHAIEVAWNKGRIENINSIFGIKVYSANEKPTNGEFIALIADKMLIEGI